MGWTAVEKAVIEFFDEKMPKEIRQGINLLGFHARYGYVDPSDVWSEDNVDDPDSPLLGKKVEDTMDAIQNWIQENVPSEVVYDTQSGEVLEMSQNALEKWVYESAEERVDEEMEDEKDDFVNEFEYEREKERRIASDAEFLFQDYWLVDNVRTMILGDANEYLRM